jgi:aspartokinase/homoserine dehydrogenase 1
MVVFHGLQSYFGANVLHPRTTVPVMKYRIPIILRNAFDLSAPGTKIWHSPMASEECEVDPNSSPDCVRVVKGFATIDDVALINVQG